MGERGEGECWIDLCTRPARRPGSGPVLVLVVRVRSSHPTTQSSAPPCTSLPLQTRGLPAHPSRRALERSRASARREGGRVRGGAWREEGRRRQAGLRERSWLPPAGAEGGAQGSRGLTGRMILGRSCGLRAEPRGGRACPGEEGACGLSMLGLWVGERVCGGECPGTRGAFCRRLRQQSFI